MPPDPCLLCREYYRLQRTHRSVAQLRVMDAHPYCKSCGALFGEGHYYQPGQNGLCTHCEKDIAAGATMKSLP